MSGIQEILDDMFQFKVGDIVYTKCANNNAHAVPNKFIITERHLNQCSGGIQFSYTIGGVLKSFKVQEIELCKEPPPYEKMSKDRFMESSIMNMNLESSFAKFMELKLKDVGDEGRPNP